MRRFTKVVLGETFSRFFTGQAARRRSASSTRRTNRCPIVESLEKRELLSATPITDLTDLAAQTPRHPDATVLHLNFDGNQSEGVSAFTGTQHDIRDIVFRTSLAAGGDEA